MVHVVCHCWALSFLGRFYDTQVEAEEPAKPVLLKKPAGPGQQKPEAESVVAQEEPAPAPAEPAPQLMARPAMKAPEPEPEPEEATLPTVESTVTKSRDNMYSGTQVTFCIGNEACCPQLYHCSLCGRNNLQPCPPPPMGGAQLWSHTLPPPPPCALPREAEC